MPNKQPDIDSHRARPKPQATARPLPSSMTNLNPVNSHRDSHAFFAKLDACARLDQLPQPVHARNLGILAEWQQWIVSLDAGYSVLPQRFAVPETCYGACLDITDAILKSDPAWATSRFNTQNQPEKITPLSVMATSSVMFWGKERAIIELTSELRQLLAQSDLGDDIPLSLLRPPLPACYICFDPASHQEVIPHPPPERNPIVGVYVFDGGLKGQPRVLSFVLIYGSDERRPLIITVVDLKAKDENETLLNSIRDLCSDSPGLAPHIQSVIQFCAKIFLYLALPQAQRSNETPYTAALAQLERVGPKKAAKLRRQVDKLYDRILLGPSEALSQDRGETAPHWRRGHFRTQPHGPQNSLRKVIFIAPVLVRADRLAAGAGNTATKPNRPNLNT